MPQWAVTLRHFRLKDVRLGLTARLQFNWGRIPDANKFERGIPIRPALLETIPQYIWRSIKIGTAQSPVSRAGLARREPKLTIHIATAPLLMWLLQRPSLDVFEIHSNLLLYLSCGPRPVQRSRSRLTWNVATVWSGTIQLRE